MALSCENRAWEDWQRGMECFRRVESIKSMSSLLSGTLPLNEAHGSLGAHRGCTLPSGTQKADMVLHFCTRTLCLHLCFWLLSFSPKHRANFTYVGNLNFLTPVLYVRGDEVITSLWGGLLLLNVFTLVYWGCGVYSVSKLNSLPSFYHYISLCMVYNKINN